MLEQSVMFGHYCLVNLHVKDLVKKLFHIVRNVPVQSNHYQDHHQGRQDEHSEPCPGQQTIL